MMRKSMLLSLFIALLPSAIVRAEPACLPASVFAKSAEDPTQKLLDLGAIAGVPTLCAFDQMYGNGLAGCWSVDATTGGLSASTAKALPGHSQEVNGDAQGCFDGYCLGPGLDTGRLPILATSTDGKHAAIVRERRLYVFDTATKKRQTVISIFDDTAPVKTNVGNDPVELLYVGDTIYVIGSDAGPFIAAWAYKDDGTRLGQITETGGQTDADNGFSVYNGAFNVIDDARIALAKTGAYKMLVLTATDGAREEIVRPIKSPCTPDEMQGVDVGDYPVKTGDGSGVSPACHAWVVKNLERYYDLDPIALPSGDFLAALNGRNTGSLAILDGKTLAEKKRLKIAKCKQ